MEWYLWIKVLHILSFLSWMAMLFYLPRLFVYHRENKDNKGFVDVVKIQEYKLYKYIGHPAMIATVITGILMLVMMPSLLQGGGWMHAKITVAVLLIAYHFSLNSLRKKLAEGGCDKSGKFFRFYNEVPTILAIFIVIFVIIRPF
ncbi:MAG: protoporphyrinogen oxidase HemJ [Campylobacterota bacterium]